MRLHVQIALIIFLSPVVSSAGKRPRLAALDQRLSAVAIIFDFVNQASPSGGSSTSVGN
jgi:hypothetical protein